MKSTAGTGRVRGSRGPAVNSIPFLRIQGDKGDRTPRRQGFVTLVTSFPVFRVLLSHFNGLHVQEPRTREAAPVIVDAHLRAGAPGTHDGDSP